MAVQDDRRELLKLKQGLISPEESQIIQEKEPEPPVKLTGIKRFENFLYHYKIPLIVVAFFLLVGLFLLKSFLDMEYGEFRTLVVANDDETAKALAFRYEQLEKAMERFTPDANNDNNVHVETFFIDIRESVDGTSYLVGTTKLHAEFSLPQGVVFVGNRQFYEEYFASVGEENAFINLEAIFPGNPNVVNGVYYQLYNSPLALAAGWEASCPEDLYLAIRKPFEDMVADKEQLEMYAERALEMLSNAIHGKIINE
jgi:hypothetical protein